MYLKQAVHSHQLQDCRGGRRQGRKFEVAVTLHGFFHAVQENFNSRTVYVLHLGTIQNNTRAVHFQQRLHLRKKGTSLRLV